VRLRDARLERRSGRLVGAEDRPVVRIQVRTVERGDRSADASTDRRLQAARLSGEIADWLRARVAKAPFTARGLATELAERGVKTTRRAIWV
jgi:hypothetical protein